MIELREGIDLDTLLKQNKQEIKLALNTGDDGFPFIVLVSLPIKCHTGNFPCCL